MEGLGWRVVDVEDVEDVEDEVRRRMRRRRRRMMRRSSKKQNLHQGVRKKTYLDFLLII